MTRRLGESLFLLNNRRITSEEHASEVAQVLDRIVNSESHGAVSKILALDTLRDAGLIGDAQLAAQKSTVLARRAASAAMRGASAGAPEMERETDDDDGSQTDPWAFMAPEESRLARRVDRARAETEAQRARIAEMYRRERADARTGVRTPERPDAERPPRMSDEDDDVVEPDDDTAGDYEPDDRDRRLAPRIPPPTPAGRERRIRSRRLRPRRTTARVTRAYGRRSSRRAARRLAHPRVRACTSPRSGLAAPPSRLARDRRGSRGAEHLREP